MASKNFCQVDMLKGIERLRLNGIGEIVETRLRQFEENRSKNSQELFSELCFCILSANCSAEKSIEIQQRMGQNFLVLPEERLAKKLRTLGYRFPNIRAKYIVRAREFKDKLSWVINSFEDTNSMREWLSKNIKGIGLKEASHFLRNIGYTDLAIIDFHIINILSRYGIISKGGSLTKRNYLHIESKLKEIGEKSCLRLAELDLYLWYMETGKILK